MQINVTDNRVSDALRGKGVGSQLMQAAEQEARLPLCAGRYRPFPGAPVL